MSLQSPKSPKSLDRSSLMARYKTNTHKFSDKEIKNLFYNIFGYLGNVSADFDYCFVGGAFIFEDNHGHLFNLLAYNQLNLTKPQCLHINDLKKVPMSPKVTMLHTLSHRSFAKRSKTAKCTRKTPQIQLIPCISNPHLCNKYQREMHFKNICNICNSYSKPGHIEDKKIILFYPFELDESYPDHTIHSKPRRYLYVKFEAEPVISVGHLTSAIDTYITKKRAHKDNALFPSRREEKPLPAHLRLTDDAFYVNRMDEGISSDESYNYFNKHVRNGSEFFVSEQLLLVFFDIYLNTKSPKLVCDVYRKNRTAKKRSKDSSGKQTSATGKHSNLVKSQD